MNIKRKLILAALTVTSLFAATGCEEIIADSARSSAISFVTSVVNSGVANALGGG